MLTRSNIQPQSSATTSLIRPSCFDRSPEPAAEVDDVEATSPHARDRHKFHVKRSPLARHILSQGSLSSSPPLDGVKPTFNEGQVPAMTASLDLLLQSECRIDAIEVRPPDQLHGRRFVA